MTDRCGLGQAGSRAATPSIVVRLPASGWPGQDLADALGDGFVVTASDQIPADVILLTGVSVGDVQNLRRAEPRVAIVVHTTPTAVVDMFMAGADVAVSTARLAEIAARIRAVARTLPAR